MGEGVIAVGPSFDGVIKGWEAGDININSIPTDEEKLKRWLKCQLFVNQTFSDVSYADPGGNIVVKKTAIEVALDFIKGIDKIVNEFMKTL